MQSGPVVVQKLKDRSLVLNLKCHRCKKKFTVAFVCTLAFHKSSKMSKSLYHRSILRWKYISMHQNILRLSKYISILIDSVD